MLLQEYPQKKNHTILGLMSGTSCDGLDMALTEISGVGAQSKLKLIAASTIEYSPAVKTALNETLNGKSDSALGLSQLNFYLAEVWAEIIASFISEHKMHKQQIDAIGSHGQTIWHQPMALDFYGKTIRSTLQLGDPSVLAQLTGIPVVGDFRVADVALGGQGAPLIPYFDWVYFSRFKQNILALNIGGISNFTLIPADADFNKVTAFDCGPGNMLIDGAMQELFGRKFDRDGQVALKGNLNDQLFEYIKAKDSFVNQQPPKSTGREHYNRDFLKNILETAKVLNLTHEDITHTISFYSSWAIYENYINYIASAQQIETIAVGGGGAKNNFLMDNLKTLFDPAEVLPVRDFGLSEEYKEAMGFALLANETLLGRSSNVKRVTGAQRPAVLGKICLV